MERNADDMFGATGSLGSVTSGTSSVGPGTGIAGSESPPGGLDYSSSARASDTSGQTADQVKTKVQEKFGQVRDKAREFQSSLADKLDAGAEKLRSQDSVAKGMNKSADWLRNGDLKADIERQVRDNPGRTLLIALGVGYVLGKAFKTNR